MINLDTTVKQREYLVSKEITAPLSPATMERLQGQVDFHHVAKLERAINDCERDLKLLPNDDVTIQRKEALEASIEESMDEVQQILSDIKSEEGANQIRQAKAREIIATAKGKILTLADELTADANKYNDMNLATLSQAVRALSQ